MPHRRKFDRTIDAPRIYGVLAEGIVRACMDNMQWPKPPRIFPAGVVEPVRARKGEPVIGQIGVSPGEYKDAAWMLWELGVAAGDSEPPAEYHHEYSLRLLIDGTNVADFLTKRVHEGNYAIPPIDEVLFVFQSCAGHHDESFGTREGQMFPGDDNYQAIFEELHHAGYLGWTDSKWRWTHRAATAMQMAGGWPDSDVVSEQEIRSGVIDDELRMMLATMPDDVRNLGRKFYVNRLWLTVSHRWRGGFWGTPPRAGEHIVLIGSRARAVRLQELIVRTNQTR